MRRSQNAGGYLLARKQLANPSKLLRLLLASSSLLVVMLAAPALGQSIVADGAVSPDPGADAGPSWSLDVPLIVGDQAAGSLDVTGGATVTVDPGRGPGRGALGKTQVGAGAAGSGTLNINDSGSRVAITSGGLVIGAADGSGEISVSNGGHLDVMGFLEINHPGPGITEYNYGDQLMVGGDGWGTLSVTDGGLVTSTQLAVGGQENSYGQVLLDGHNSRMELQENLVLNNGGMVVSGGAQLETLADPLPSGTSYLVNQDKIGSGSTAPATMTVTGNETEWTSHGFVRVGDSARGSLVVEEGARVEAELGLILGFGRYTFGVNEVIGNIKLDAATLETGVLQLGAGGAVSRVAVGNGATLNTGSLLSGDGATITADGPLYSDVIIDVTGSGTSWTNGVAGMESLLLGGGGNNRVQLSEGAQLTNLGTAIVGSRGSGEAAGIGYVDIASGSGMLVDGDAILGDEEDSVGTIGVSDAGSLLSVTGAFIVGNGANGVLLIQRGGTVRADQLDVAQSATAHGTVIIGGATDAEAAGQLEIDNLVFGAGAGELVFNHTDQEYLFDHALSGAGLISHRAGTTILAGSNSGFVGAIDIIGGTVDLAGTYGGTATVGTGGKLMGSGEIGSLVVNGTLAPGNSIGTLYVDGDATFNQGSSYQVELNAAGDSDFLLVRRDVTITGGTVAIDAEAGNYAPETDYAILASDEGSVSGAFDDVTSNFAYLIPTLDYQGDVVLVHLVRANADVGDTANQNAVEDQILSAQSSLFDAIIGLSEDDARAALDNFSGEIHASAQALFVEDSAILRDAALNRAGTEGSAPQSGEMVDPLTGQGLGLWGVIFAKATELPDDGNAAELDATSGGIIAGLDGVAGDWRLGALLSYGQTFASVGDARASSLDSDDYGFGVYAGTNWNDTKLKLGAAFANHFIATERNVAVGPLNETITADYNATTAQVFAELSHQFALGNGTALEPFAQLAVVGHSTEGFDEEGGASALGVDSSTFRAALGTIGVRGSAEFALDGAMQVKLTGALGYRHAFADAPEVENQFALGDSFTIAGAPLVENALVVEAGVDFDVNSNTNLNLSYKGQFGDDTAAHAAKATFSYSF